jgi:hypothetical protein
MSPSAMGADDLVYLPPGVHLREPIHNEDGVDLTQIRLMLDLTLIERLRAPKEFTDLLERLLARIEKWTPKGS